ncbi:MAG: hypothetical protein QOF51_2649 [Chloroflexota bacterium]|nr:hypothetical protein [Chloroflexota bacterium]
MPRRLVNVGFILTAVGLTSFLVYSTVFAPRFFEDNAYNQALLERSALPGAGHFLESSLVHVLFQAYPIPRAEEWHRGLPIVVARLWIGAVGHTEWLMRLPHLIWVSAWFAIAGSILRALNRAQDEHMPRALSSGVTCAIVVALSLTTWAQPILRLAFLDDVPAATFALTAILVLNSKRLSFPSAALAGLLCGLAFDAKDFYLVWLPMGMGLMIGIQMLRKGPMVALREEPGFTAAFALGAVMITAPRLIWERIDLGTVLSNPSQYWMLAHYFGRGPVGEHYPFFLFGDPSYQSRLALAGGPRAAIGMLLSRSTPQIIELVWGMALSLLPFIGAIVARDHAIPLNQRAKEIIVCLLVATVVLLVFFACALGDASQQRYWIVPITLLVVSGIHLLSVRVRLTIGRRSPLFKWKCVGLGFAMFLLWLPSVIVYGRAAIGVYSPLAPAEAALLDQATPQEAGVLLGTAEGIYFWSLHPERKVVAFDERYFQILTPSQVSELVSIYHIGGLLLGDPLAISRLTALGFQEEGTAGREVLLVPGTGG